MPTVEQPLDEGALNRMKVLANAFTNARNGESFPWADVDEAHQLGRDLFALLAAAYTQPPVAPGGQGLRDAVAAFQLGCRRDCTIGLPRADAILTLILNQGALTSGAAGWRPIESAPENEAILVLCPRFEHYGHGVLRAMLVNMGSGSRWHSCGWHVGRDIGPEDWPTHWMPLPAPPAAGG